MHVYISCRQNYIRTPEIPSSSYRKLRTSSERFNFRKDCFYSSCVITKRKKKIKKSCNVSHKNQEVDKAVHQATFDRKYDKWSMEVKGGYACVKTHCTIYSVV